MVDNIDKGRTSSDDVENVFDEIQTSKLRARITLETIHQNTRIKRCWLALRFIE